MTFKTRVLKQQALSAKMSEINDLLTFKQMRSIRSNKYRAMALEIICNISTNKAVWALCEELMVIDGTEVESRNNDIVFLIKEDSTGEVLFNEGLMRTKADAVNRVDQICARQEYEFTPDCYDILTVEYSGPAKFRILKTEKAG